MKKLSLAIDGLPFLLYSDSYLIRLLYPQNISWNDDEMTLNAAVRAMMYRWYLGNVWQLPNDNPETSLFFLHLFLGDLSYFSDD